MPKKNTDNANTLLKSLLRTCSLLKDSRIDYMIVGGMAVSVWSTPRATVDIDFVISLNNKEFHILQDVLASRPEFIFIHRTPMKLKNISMLRAVMLIEGREVVVDFILCTNRFLKGALKRKKSLEINNQHLSIGSPEDIILLKLLSGRPQDIVDADHIISAQKKNLDFIYLEREANKLKIKWKNFISRENTSPLSS